MSERTIDFRYAPTVSWTCICRPDDPFKSLVREDGALLYDFHGRGLGLEVWRFDRVFAFGLQALQPPVRVTQSTESARVPIVTTRLEYADVTLTLRACGHQHGDRRTDVLRWTVAAPDVDEFLTRFQVTAQAPGRYLASATLAPGHRIYMGDEATRPDVDFWATVNHYLVEPPDAAPIGPLALVSVPQPLLTVHAQGFTSASGLGTELFAVGRDRVVEGALLFPLNHEQVDDVDLDWAQAAVATERRFWQGLPLQTVTLETPDPAVNDMIVACARNILQAREIEDGLPVFKVGPTIYRSLFVVDGHFFLEAARYLGYADDASAGVDTLVRRANADGSFSLIPDHNKETGIALATLVRQAELSGDWEKLRGEWPLVRRAVDHIRGLRRQAAALDPADPAHGLMPASYCDGGLGGKRPEYSTALWTLFGLKEIARGAARLGFADDAAAFQAEFDALLADFRRCAARDQQTTADGIPYLPMRMPGGSGDHHWIPDYPLDVPPWHRINPGTGTWALAQAIYPGEIFAPDDPIVQNFCALLDTLDDEEGIPAATGWLPYKALWSYAGSFYAHAWLYAGRPDKAADYLYAFANHATPTRVWREEQSLRNTGHGQTFGDMPHNWASVEFIRLVRNLLVFERGDCLELLAGLPAEWVGKPLRVAGMPTRFGTVTLTVASGDGRTVSVTVDIAPHQADKRVAPREIRLYMPAAVDAVQLDGEPRVLESGGYLLLPARGRARVTFALP